LVNFSIEEVSAAQQAALSQWALRPFTFSLGNALFNFESSVIVPTEIYTIPKLKKSARLSPMNALIELTSSPANDIFVDWPEFHTGVAAALQIRGDCQDVNSSWIVFNQVKSVEVTKVDTSHAGFIYGLGLLGHLKKLDSSDSLRNYFLPQHEILSVGHLLGLAAAHIGSRHPQITNMLSVHLPSMLPNQSIELNTGFVLKTGAMIGYGLLHFSHPSQYKFDKVFSEIDQVEVTENSTENSGNGSYLIGCGFSLVS
jgi:anaphase-promoting complex subunit 1